MNRLIWREDSIARRFVLTVALVVGGTLGLVALFFMFGGAWSAPSLERSGLFERASDIYRLMAVAPPSLRPQLAVAGMSEKFRINWFAEGSAVARSLNDMPPTPRESTVVRSIQHLMGDQQKVLVFEPESPRAPPDSFFVTDSTVYRLALPLPDGSWIVYTADHRIWGVTAPQRWMIWVSFLSLATILVTGLAARRLVRPIQQFTEAIRLFGTNPQAPPMQEVGPVEFRGVISAFNIMQGQIQRLMSSRTEMLAAISHDLRTPLTRIRLRGEFIRDPAQQARLFRDVDELQQMIDGALAFFRGDAHQETMTSLDLPSILQTIASDFADHGAAVSYQGPARLPYLGRPVALKRALTNLVENAVKYGTPPEIRLFFEPTQVIITVTDHGTGIPQEALDRVFQPFYRLEGSRNRATGGVGLGLTATRSIIGEHGGVVTLANLPEGGLEARVSLPNTTGVLLFPGSPIC